MSGFGVDDPLFFLQQVGLPGIALADERSKQPNVVKEELLSDDASNSSNENDGNADAQKD